MNKRSLENLPSKSKRINAFSLSLKESWATYFNTKHPEVSLQSLGDRKLEQRCSWSGPKSSLNASKDLNQFYWFLKTQTWVTYGESIMCLIRIAEKTWQVYCHLITNSSYPQIMLATRVSGTINHHSCQRKPYWHAHLNMYCNYAVVLNRIIAKPRAQPAWLKQRAI